MKAIAVNEEQGGFQQLSGFDRQQGNRTLGGSVIGAIYDRILGQLMDKLGGQGTSEGCSYFVGHVNGEAGVGGGGGSVSLGGINLASLNAAHPEEVKLLLADLSIITGLKIDLDDNGYMRYQIPEGKLTGSITAALFFIGAMNRAMASEEIVNVIVGKACRVSTMNQDAPVDLQNTIELSIDEVYGYIDGTSADLNNKTSGFGMVFLHELGHTRVGGRLMDDTPDNPNYGPNIDLQNQIRRELGASWGQEKSHNPTWIAAEPTKNFFPYSNHALEALKQGKIPDSGYIWIKRL